MTRSGLGPLAVTVAVVLIAVGVSAAIASSIALGVGVACAGTLIGVVGIIAISRGPSDERARRRLQAERGLEAMGSGLGKAAGGWDSRRRGPRKPHR